MCVKNKFILFRLRQHVLGVGEGDFGGVGAAHHLGDFFDAFFAFQQGHSVVARPALTDLEILKCRSANEAIWGRWVIRMT